MGECQTSPSLCLLTIAMPLLQAVACVMHAASHHSIACAIQSPRAKGSNLQTLRGREAVPYLDLTEKVHC